MQDVDASQRIGRKIFYTAYAEIYYPPELTLLSYSLLALDVVGIRRSLLSFLLHLARCATMSTSPLKLDYSTTTYLAISSALPPVSIASAASNVPFASTGSSSSPPLTYAGPVGALDNEHIFALPGIPSDSPPNQRAVEIKQQLERLGGVLHVEIMVPKQRASRKFEC